PIELQVKAKLAAAEVSTPEAKRPPHSGGRVGQRWIALPGEHTVDLDWPADMLGPGLTAVAVDIIVRQFGNLAHHPGHGNASRVGHHLDAFGQVHALAEDIVTFLVNNDFTDVHADPKE